MEEKQKEEFEVKEPEKKAMRRPGLYDNIDMSERTINIIIGVVTLLLIIAIILGITTK